MRVRPAVQGGMGRDSRLQTIPHLVGTRECLGPGEWETERKGGLERERGGCSWLVWPLVRPGQPVVDGVRSSPRRVGTGGVSAVPGCLGLAVSVSLAGVGEQKTRRGVGGGEGGGA